MTTQQVTPQQPPPLVRVSIATIQEGTQNFSFNNYSFNAPFRIGRGDDCEVCIKDDHVSRHHAQGAYQNGQWWVWDLKSSNGLYLGDKKVERIQIGQATTFRLGVYGPIVSIEVENAALPKAPPAAETVVAQYMEHYFGAGQSLPGGEHTMLVRQAFHRVQKKQRWKYAWIIAVLVVAALGAGGYAYYEHQQTSKQKSMAENIFYSMKSLDLDIAGLENVVLDSHSAQGKEEVKKYQQRRKEMEKNYDQFVTTLHVYDPKMTEQDRLVLRVARIFGECEVAMPPGLVTEVETYIKKWQSTGRLKNAVRLAQEKGYTRKIADEFLAQDLPPQFYYLGLQESDFDQFTSGPPTRMGIAKGMWQFIPETGIKYGLQIGPLADLRRADPGDDRHNYEKATKAAARYIKDLYTTEAQASGLLVMACYNWGEGRVLPLVRSMPPNPRERNFWKLLQLYRDKLPPETYDYVLSIFSAAVIGENPRLFGFDFDNPLGHLEQR